jgi:hypothetical protein
MRGKEKTRNIKHAAAAMSIACKLEPRAKEMWISE